MKENYPFQTAAVREILNEFDRGVTSTAAIMATGCGKSRVFSQVAQHFFRQHRKPVLILTHRTELVEQIEGCLREMEISYAREKAGSFASETQAFDVVVACTPTLAKKGRLEQFAPDFFSLIITDECHHAVCRDNRKIYKYFAGTRHLGVTATPLRHDRVGLKNIFQSVAFQYPIQTGIAQGYLCKLSARRIKVEGLDLEKVELAGNDFSRAEIDELLMQDGVLARMVLPTIEYAGDRQTIVFAENLEHARKITESFNRHKGRNAAITVDSTLSADVRRKRLARYHSAAAQFLVNVGICTEGFDDPRTACVALYRPTKSLGLLAQMIGRGTRIFPGKRDCLVLDFVGVNRSVRTISVLDVLDGAIVSDREYDLAQNLLEQGLSPTEALREAKLEAAKLARIEVKWKALSSANAFDVMALFALPSCKGLYGGDACTAAQRAFLEKAGLKVSAHMEKGEASGLIAEIIRRRNGGLATLKQLGYLQKLGDKEIDVDRLGFQDASSLIQQRLGARQYSYAAR